MCNQEEDIVKQNIAARTQPFWAEARINIPSYDGSINTEVLDSWIYQLDTYFDLYDYNREDRMMLVQLKLIGQALAW